MNSKNNFLYRYLLLRSRCPEIRPQDIAKSVAVLKELCWPDMKRFLDIKQQNGIKIYTKYYRPI